ncbi:hypothetical protein BD779DRAFT_1512936 [Infundibulicybe gibba]|nr:hypothetical protein BD779DRAFT_1512936 [Infundibulicybe gibba]
MLLCSVLRLAILLTVHGCLNRPCTFWRPFKPVRAARPISDIHGFFHNPLRVLACSPSMYVMVQSLYLRNLGPVWN